MLPCLPPRRICLPNTYSHNHEECLSCPAGLSTIFAGTASVAGCRTPEALKTLVDTMFSRPILSDKLVKIPAMEAKLNTMKSCESAVTCMRVRRTDCLPDDFRASASAHLPYTSSCFASSATPAISQPPKPPKPYQP